jgi:hypothetical protein
MSYNDSDYQRLADAAVTDFIRGGVPLVDSAIKIAKEHSLNVHEARRLVEATNVATHLTLFDKMAEHKYVEFNVVDPDTVCDTLFADPDRSRSADCGIDKVASDLSLDVPDERWAHLRVKAAAAAAAEFQKVASIEVPLDPYRGVRAHQAINKLAATRDALRTNLSAAYIKYEEKVAAVQHAFTFIDAPNRAEFEKDAFALHDRDEAAHVLLAVFGDFSQEKTSSAPRYVDAKKEHALFKAAIDARAEARKHASVVTWFEENAKNGLVE